MNMEQARAVLYEEYDSVEQTSLNEWSCYLEYIEEFHFVTLKDGQLWGYNGDTGHVWLIS